jgi:hypothetical protein
MCVNLCVFVIVHTEIYTCIYVYMCVYIYIYIYICYAQTRIRTHTQDDTIKPEIKFKEQFACLNTLVHSFKSVDNTQDINLQLVFKSVESREKYWQLISVVIHGKGDPIYDEACTLADIHSPVFSIHVEGAAVIDGGVEAIFDVPAPDEEMRSFCFMKKASSTSSTSQGGIQQTWELVEGHFLKLDCGRKLRGCVFTDTFSSYCFASSKLRVATHRIEYGVNTRVDTILFPATGQVPIPRTNTLGKQLDEKKRLLKECSQGFLVHRNKLIVKDGDRIEMVLVRYMDEICEISKTLPSIWRHAETSSSPKPLGVPQDVRPDEPLKIILKRNGQKQPDVAGAPLNMSERTRMTISDYFPHYMDSSNPNFYVCNDQACGRKFDLWTSMWGGKRSHCDFCGDVFCSEHSSTKSEFHGARLCRKCAELLLEDSWICPPQSLTVPTHTRPSSIPPQSCRTHGLFVDQLSYSGLVVFTSSKDTSDGVNAEAEAIRNIMAPKVTPVYEDVNKFDFILSINEDHTKNALHFSGHGRDGKSFLFQPETFGGDPEVFAHDNLSTLIKKHASVQCVFLNACRTYDLGSLIFDQTRVTYVICWAEDVLVDVAVNFATKYYTYLKLHPNAYGESFCMTCLEIERADKSIPGKPCILHRDGDRIYGDAVLCPLDQDMVRQHGQGPLRLCWSRRTMVHRVPPPGIAPAITSFISDEQSSGLRNWAPVGWRYDQKSKTVKPTNAETDYSAKAGAMERRCLEVLGIHMKYQGIEIGGHNPEWTGSPWNGIGPNNCLDKIVMQTIMPSVKSYTKLWGASGYVVKHSSNRADHEIQNAIHSLSEVVKYRTADMKNKLCQENSCLQQSGGLFCRCCFYSSLILMSLNHNLHMNTEIYVMTPTLFGTGLVLIFAS